jgi:hypothetical protein
MIKITPHPAWIQVLGKENVEAALTFVALDLARTLGQLDYAAHVAEEAAEHGPIQSTNLDHNRLQPILALLSAMNSNEGFEDDPMDEFIDAPENTPFSRQSKAIASYLLRDIARMLEFMAGEITATGPGVIVRDITE